MSEITSEQEQAADDAMLGRQIEDYLRVPVRDMLKETRQRLAHCDELGCGPFHPGGHVVTETRIVTPWRTAAVDER